MRKHFLPFVREQQDAFDYWLCHSHVAGERPFFIFLTSTSHVNPDMANKPWFSFIEKPWQQRDVMDDSWTLLDISGSKDEMSNYLYSNRDIQPVDNPELTVETVKAPASHKNRMIQVIVDPAAKDYVFTVKDNRILRLKSNYPNDSIDIQLKYRNGTLEYFFNFRVYIPTRGTEYREAWLDFGSEASQYGVIGRNMERDITHTAGEIFQDFKEIYNQGTTENSLIKQYDNSLHPTDAVKLIKTRLYVDEQRPNDNILNGNMFSAQEDALLYFTPLGTSTHPNLLPNLKLLLSQTGMAADYKFRIGGKTYHLNESDSFDLVCSVMRTYIQVLLNGMRKRDESAEFYVKVTCLFPNTLKQATIFRILYALYQELDKQRQEGKLPAQIKGIELDSIPESDASLMSKPELSKETGYNEIVLSIDCGKGTTDIGVYQAVRRGHDKVFKRLLRTGMPAAGNYLTVAVTLDLLLTYINSFAKGMDDRPVNKKKLVRDCLAKIIELSVNSDDIWNEMESLKKIVSAGRNIPAYSTGKQIAETDFVNEVIIDIATSKPFSTALSGGRQPKLEDSIAIGHTFTDDFIRKLVRVCTGPINMVDANIKAFGLASFNVTRLSLSGRGFLFKPFREALVQELSARYPSLAREGALKLPSASSEYDWKQRSVDGVKNIGFIEKHGFLDYLLAGGKNWIHRVFEPPRAKALFKMVNDAVTYNYFDRDPSHRFRFGNNSIISGSYEMRRPHGEDISPRVSYRYFFDGLDYRFAIDDKSKKENFSVKPIHEVNNQDFEQLPIISQMPNVSLARIDNILGFVDDILK
ncbi:MAG TPA: hypothetical protein VD993_15480 [Chitinophagaceae bacterium]|nr:hypothetical protein [Chitinophagaceae bacterium]